MIPPPAADRGPLLVRILRWLGRVGSVVSIGVLIYFAASVGKWPASAGWTGLAFLPIFAAGGMVIGWWHELAGGSVALGSLCAFHALLLMFRGTIGGPGFLAFVLPGLLMFVTGLLMKRIGGRPDGQADVGSA